MPRVVLDTGALWSPAVIREAAKAAETKLVLPAVACTERARQMQRDGRNLRDLNRLISEIGIIVEDFGPEHGLKVAAKVTDDKEWERLSRDAMIAGHLGRDDLLLTANAPDFLDLGIPSKQILVVRRRRSLAGSALDRPSDRS